MSHCVLNNLNSLAVDYNGQIVVFAAVNTALSGTLHHVNQVERLGWDLMTHPFQEVVLLQCLAVFPLQE